MADNDKVESALHKLFFEDGHRIVFWHDPEHGFEILVSLVKVDGVKLLRLDQMGAFELKLKLEREDPTGKYLIYSSTEEPGYEQDWLLDIRLYSGIFRADQASLILADLGLAQQQLREHISRRRKFFDSKDRMRKLRELITPNDSAADLDRKMLAVATKASQAELFDIVRTLFHAYTGTLENEPIDLATPPDAWQQVEKFDLAESFWSMVKATFGYDEEKPTLHNLLIRLLMTDFAHSLKGELPMSLRHLVLSNQANVVVCLDQWRDSSKKSGSYDQLSALVAESTRIADQIAGCEIEDLLDVMTFLEVEKAIMSGLRDRIVATAGVINAEAIRETASRRLTGHWATMNSATSAVVPREAVRAVYGALVDAARFFELRNRYRNAMNYETAVELYRAYEGELYQFDQLYRHFCQHADQARQWDVLKGLRNDIEAAYVNGFLTPLALTWGRFVEPPGGSGLLAQWRMEGVPNEYQFFAKYIQSPASGGEMRRVFVIISDALRYEAAHELLAPLNGKYRFQAEMTSQLGVLPSYTALGMASLLPHKTLEYKATGEVLVDGKPTATLEQRGEILAGHNGMAVRAEELMDKSRDEGREFIKGRDIIYIYHNRVDAVGDDAKTEGDTFNAVEQTIQELAELVGHLINNLNGSLIYITADHGFLFTESAPTETEKRAISFKPDGTVLAKKRYLLGHHLPDSSFAWHGTTSVSAKADGDMEFWLPRGLNRFHFAGGARFVHGGAMLQEIVVPILTVRQVRREAAVETKTKPVSVHVLGSNHKITTSRHRFELFQMEPVSERVKPITLRIAVYDGDAAVSNLETVTFDSTSGNMDERRKWVSLVLKDGVYDKKKNYHLVLRDAETDQEHPRVEVIIDRAFNNDF
jgi:uncharacterized protein (TIGR02687 family)